MNKQLTSLTLIALLLAPLATLHSADLTETINVDAGKTGRTFGKGFVGVGCDYEPVKFDDLSVNAVSESIPAKESNK